MYSSIGLLLTGAGLETWAVWVLFVALFVTFLSIAVFSLKPFWELFFHVSAPTAREAFEQFNPDCYEGLWSLFDRDDFEFLESQPGYTRDLGVRFRRERIRVAELYLRRLRQDARAYFSFLNQRLAFSSGNDADGFSSEILRSELLLGAAVLFTYGQLFALRTGFRFEPRFRLLSEPLQHLYELKLALPSPSW